MPFRRLITLFMLLCCGAVLASLQADKAQAASLGLAPSDTATPIASPTPGCNDWRQEASPTGGDLINPIYGIATVSASNVWAVGFKGGYGSTHPHVLIEHWDGTQWSLMPANNAGILQGVAVVAADDIWAVGYYDDPAKTLTMHWNGTDWSIVASPSEQGVSNNLYGVAAAGANDVWAVGNARNQSRVLHWNGTEWDIVPTPLLEYGYLNAVTVAGPNDVWAVGMKEPYSIETYIMHWNGTEWTQVDSPNQGTYSNSLQAVSAVSAHDIWAAGWSSDGQSFYNGMIMHWDGTQWSVSPISGAAQPQTAGSTRLYGIAASSANEAWAVGWSTDDSTRENVVLGWDGTSWSTANAPDPSLYFDELFAVTAAAPGEAWAGGYLGRDSDGYYDPQILHYGPQCTTPTPTATGTRPTATNTSTSTLTSTSTITPTPQPTVCGTLLSEGFEQGTLGLFTNVVTTCENAGCNWINSTVAPHTGTRNAFAPDLAGVSDQRLILTSPVVPASGSTLTFWHNYDFEGQNNTYFDGGVLEGSVDAGATWFDMGEQILAGGYGGTIAFTFDNPLANREAWVGNSGGYIQTVVDLSSYAGQNLMFRFREGTDTSLGANGWRIDDVLISGGGSCATATPPAATATATGTAIATATIPPTSTAASTETVLATDTPSAQPTSTDVPTSVPGETETATPEATAGACNISFSDVQPGSTFYNSVVCLACNGVMSGYSDGTFRPYNNVTRGQVAKLVSNAAGFSTNVAPNTQTFEDVTTNSTFYIYIERVAAQGIIGGYACGSAAEPCSTDNKPYFRPGANATRGQISKIVANTAQMEDVPTHQMFADVQTDSAFYLWVERLAMHDMIGGYPCGAANEPCGADNMSYFRPGANATRGQISKIIANTFAPSCQTAPGR